MKSCPQCGKSYSDTDKVCPDDRSLLIQIAVSSDPMLGRLIADRFLLVEKLGQGGMGTVYKAIHTKMDRVCAIKMLSPYITDNHLAVARFKREAKMASRIDNPHAVTIYDFGEAEGGLLYLAMEYIDGKSLARVLAQESPLAVERVVNITRQISLALSAAHALGIVHRDLKPDNIMLTRKDGEADYVKVLDFGIAKTVADAGQESITNTGLVLGTPIYMSPEQVSGEELDARSDIYSLAIIVYQMLSGRLPFEGSNPQAVMIKRITGLPIPLRRVAPSVNEWVEQTVMAGLARDRETRIQSARELTSQLSTTLLHGTQALGSQRAAVAADTSPAPVGKAPTSLISYEPTEPAHGKMTAPVQAMQSNEYSPATRNRFFARLNWKHYTAAGAALVALISLPIALTWGNKISAPQAPAVVQPSQTAPAAEPAGNALATPSSNSSLLNNQAGTSSSPSSGGSASARPGNKKRNKPALAVPPADEDSVPPPADEPAEPPRDRVTKPLRDKGQVYTAKKEESKNVNKNADPVIRSIRRFGDMFGKKKKN